MKKFFKILFILIILIILIVLINTIRNVYIINKLRNNSNKYFSDISSYKIKTESHFSYYEPNNDNKIDETDITEVYFKDNIYVIKEYINGELINTETTSIGKISNYPNSPTYSELMKIDFIMKEDFHNNIIKLYLLNFIKTNENDYILDGSEGKFYYNKDTGLLSLYNLSSSRYVRFYLEKNNVEDNDMPTN